MANERYNAEIGLSFVGGNVASQVQAEIQRILREADAATKSAGGILDLKVADQFGERLGQAIRRAVNQDIKGSALYDLMRPKDQKALLGAQVPAPTSSFIESQLRLLQAEGLRNQVYARAALTPGSKGTPTVKLPDGSSYIAKPYADVATRDTAIRSAELAYARATNAATAARVKFVEGLAGAERQQQEAVAKETVAIIRRTQAEEKAAQDTQAAELRGVLQVVQAAAKRRDAAQKAAEATEAGTRQEQTATARTILAMERRREADEKAAEAETSRVQGLSDARQARNFPVSYPAAGSNPNEKLGAAQEAVNIAERNVAIAENRLAEADDKLANDRSRVNANEVLRAQNSLEQAMRGETAARRRVEQEEVRASELLGKANSSQQFGLLSQFGQGFKGVSDRPFAEQIGQAFKFSVFYGTAYKALFALTQTFQQTLQEGIQFQDSVTELRLATGQSAQSATDLANQIGREASAYGFAPSAAVAIGARAQGYYGTSSLNVTSGADAAQNRALQADVARLSARVVNQVAFASGGQPADLQGQIAAITQAYGLGYQSQQYIGDLDAYMSRKFGINPGETIGAIAESGTVGRAAGFSPAEVSAIAADIQARTGASPSATGGFLAQIFSRSGEGSLTALTQRYGINQNTNLAQQFAQLAQVYARQPSQRDDIAAAFGRGKVQNAVIALLQDYPEVRRSAAAAVTGAPGALDRATNLRLDNIGGQIQQFQGVLRQFANDLGQSGLLDDLGVLVIGLKDLVTAADDVLQVFNLIPRSGRDLIFTFGLLAAAARVAAGAQGEQGALGVLGGLSRGNLVTASTLTRQRAVVTAAGDVVPLASLRGARTAAGGVLGGLGGLGVAAAVLGDAVLWSKTRDATNRYNQAASDFADTISSAAGQDLSTPEGLQARASLLKQQEAEQRAAASGFFASVKNLGADNNQAIGNADYAKTEAARLEAASQIVAAHNDAIANSTPGAAITAFDSDSLNTSLQAITQSGGTARTEFDALASSLDAAGRAANRVSTFDPQVFAATNAQSIFESILKHPGFSTSSKPNAAGDVLNNFIKGASFGLSDGPIGSSQGQGVQSLIESVINPSQIQSRLQEALAGVTDPSKLSGKKLQAIAANVLGDAPDKIISQGGFDFSELPQLRAYLTKVVEDQIKSLATGTGGLAANIKLTQDQLTATVDQLTTTAQASLQDLPTTDYKGRIAQQRALIENIKKAIEQTAGGSNAEADKQLLDARRGLANAQFDQLEAERKAAQQAATSVGGVAAAGHAALVREIGAAVKGRDPDLLSKIIAQSGNEAIALAKQAIRQAISTARAAEAIQAAAAEVAVAAGTDFGHGGSYAAAQNPAIGQLQGLLSSLGNDVTGGKGGDVYQTGGDVPGGGFGGTAADIAAAAAQADAIRKQGQIAKARADIVAAHAAMDDAKKGSVAYYQALGQLYTAQQELAQAIVQYRENLYLLGHDVTNPLTQARAAAIAAAATLRNDKGSGAAADQIAADKVALEQAQANAESTAFQQRLQSVQTADELGRISHTKYLAYLAHEHDRLESIKHRTYQQQQELDQVDGLIKSANDALQGEFNFGDIKLPTPYEVQRRLQEVYGNQAGGLNNSSDPFLANGAIGHIHGTGQQNNNFYFNGADIGTVKKVVKEALGDRSTTSTTAVRHR